MGGTLVVAANDSPAGVFSPVVIYSTDGTNWNRANTDGADFANVRLDFLFEVAGGLLLEGESTLPDPLCAGGEGSICNAVPATLMWRSTDGRAWHPLTAAALAPFHRVAIYSMAGGRAGLVAFGHRMPVEGNGTSLVLHSTDGASWGVADFPDQGFMVEQPITTSGGFVALGTTYPEPPSAGGVQPTAGPDPAAWYSSDGVKWTRAAMSMASAVNPDHGAWYPAAGASGFAATDTSISPPVTWLVSADGRAWNSADAFPSTSGSTWLAGDGNEILVVSGPSVYWSQDGRTWQGGVSTPPMPNTASSSGLFQRVSPAWIFGSMVIAEGDINGLYVGRVAVR